MWFCHCSLLLFLFSHIDVQGMPDKNLKYCAIGFIELQNEYVLLLNLLTHQYSQFPSQFDSLEENATRNATQLDREHVSENFLQSPRLTACRTIPIYSTLIPTKECTAAIYQVHPRIPSHKGNRFYLLIEQPIVCLQLLLASNLSVKLRMTLTNVLGWTGLSNLRYIGTKIVYCKFYHSGLVQDGKMGLNFSQSF